ncbi:hypothetical protein PENSPDRAFT_747308 [Peniophora sp. CONT]|nr:hypothetical protein PENSPDRAFT_747308 [Peniophora sp. CONT]
MGRRRAAYVVTVGLQVGVFDTWLSAAPHIYHLPKGSIPIHQGFDSRPEAQAAYDEALHNGTVRIIHPVTGEETRVLPDFATSARTTRRRVSSSSSPTQSLASPRSPISRDRRDIANPRDESRHTRRGRTESSVRLRDTADGAATEVNSTSSSPPTGITQVAASDVSSSRAGQQTRHGIQGVRSGQATPASSPRRPLFSSASTDGVFSSPETDAPTHHGPPNYRHVRSSTRALLSKSTQTVDRSLSGGAACDANTHCSVSEPPDGPSTPRRREPPLLEPMLRSRNPTPGSLSSASPLHTQLPLPTTPPPSTRGLDELLPELIGLHVNITPRLGARRRQMTLTPSPSAPGRLEVLRDDRTDIRCPQTHVGNAEVVHMGTQEPGTLTFSQSDIEVYDISSSSEDEDTDELDDSSSQSSDTGWHTARDNQSARSSPLAGIVREQMTDSLPSSERRFFPGRAQGLTSPTRHEVHRTASEPAPQHIASSSETPAQRQTSTPGPSHHDTSSVEFASPPFRSTQIALSPRHERARVYSPRADPRSPILDSTLQVPNPFEGRDIAHFGRPTPPQNFAAFNF